MVWVAGFEPAASPAQTEYSTRLSYTQINGSGGGDRTHKLWFQRPVALPICLPLNMVGSRGLAPPVLILPHRFKDAGFTDRWRERSPFFKQKKRGRTKELFSSLILPLFVEVFERVFV